MRSALLVIGLLPPKDFARFLRDLRARYPEAPVTALIGNPELHSADPGAEQYLLWSDLPPRALAAEIRRRRFALLIVAFNPEYYYSLTYWKVLLLAAASRAKGVLFCKHGRLPDTVPSLSQIRGAPLRITAMWSFVIFLHVVRLIAILLLQLLFLVLGMLLLLPLLGVALVDVGVWIARLFRPPRRNQAGPR